MEFHRLHPRDPEIGSVMTAQSRRMPWHMPQTERLNA